MQNALENFFTYLSKQLLISLLIFFGITFMIIKLYERFISGKIKSKFKFLNNYNRETYFVILLSGVLFFIIILFFKLKCNVPIPFIWLLCSSSFVIGGTLGLIPFSFIEKRKSK